MTKRIFLSLLIGCFYFSISFSQKFSNEFLSIGVGARAQGQGNAVVASVDDVTAGVWNPAGLMFLDIERGLQLGAMHAEWFGGVGKFDYLAAAIPIAQGRRRLGLSFIRFGIDEIPNTLSLYESDGTINFDNLREFSAADYAFLVSYAQNLLKGNNKLSIGGNVKIVYRQIGPFANSWGFGVDLGAQYRSQNFYLGLMARDITTTFNAWSFNFTNEEKEVLALTNNEIPINSVEITNPQLILGLAYRFDFGKSSLRPELNWVITTDGQRNTLVSSDPFSVDPAIGLEYNYQGFLWLRAGANQFQRERDFDNTENLTLRPSIGVGFRLGTLNVDYAFTDLGSQQNTFSHVISATLDIRPGGKQ